jgi:hypothetical protein
MPNGGFEVQVFELVQPGSCLEDISDADEHRETRQLIGLLVQCVDEAAVALALFESNGAQGGWMTPEEFDQAAAVRSTRTRAIAKRLERDLPATLTVEERWYASRSIDQRAEILAKQEAWSAGEMPRSYLGSVPFLYAKAFLYALDTLLKGLRALSKLSSAPDGVAAALTAYEKAFPSLKHVRDSTHHAEDRVRRRNRNQKTIALRPVDDGNVRTTGGGALFLNVLDGNRFGCTLEDGGYGAVEVSSVSASAARDIVQQVLDSYRWRGSPVHMPS